jgi:hypothetical protein
VVEVAREGDAGSMKTHCSVELGKLRSLSWPDLTCPVVIRRRSGSRAALDHLGTGRVVSCSKQGRKRRVQVSGRVESRWELERCWRGAR